VRREGSGRLALVTGASAGIGQAFAEILAEHGFDLVLTARRAERLHTLARDLAARHQVVAHVVVEDLADPAASQRLVEELSQRGLRVDVLVNNAGYGVPGGYQSTTWPQQDAFLQVMVVALSELTHRLLPGMIERRWGRIINVASLAGLLPGVAGHTLYAASKAFVVKFSESLAPEVRDHGVHVTALCPGMTLSEFHDVTGTRRQVSQLPRFLWLDAATVARQGYDAVMRGDVVYVNGRLNRAMALAAKMLPRRIAGGLLQRNARKFRKV
jgi:short-subunit dehydrogenase